MTQNDFPCPVCESSDWKPIEKFEYRAEDHAPGRDGKLARLTERIGTAARILFYAAPRNLRRTQNLDSYLRLRRRILFEVWFPQSKTVHFETQYCAKCGFVASAPRPSEKDLEDAALFLQKWHPDTGGDSFLGPIAKRHNVERAERILKIVTAEGPNGKWSVLDFGGGNGKILVPFMDEGHQCFLVDYNDRPIPGVVKLSDTISGIPEGQTFDVILCNHVLEHLDNPLETVRLLSGFLSERGVLYAEVPMEIWAGVRIAHDPVTHCNRFTPSSLRVLFEKSGYRVQTSELAVSSYDGRRKQIIWLLARGGATAEAQCGYSPEETLKHLYPSRLRSLSLIVRTDIIAPLVDLALKLALRVKGGQSGPKPQLSEQK